MTETSGGAAIAAVARTPCSSHQPVSEQVEVGLGDGVFGGGHGDADATGHWLVIGCVGHWLVGWTVMGGGSPCRYGLIVHGSERPAQLLRVHKPADLLLPVAPLPPDRAQLATWARSGRDLDADAPHFTHRQRVLPALVFPLRLSRPPHTTP
jgi:hypothetical protein